MIVNLIPDRERVCLLVAVPQGIDPRAGDVRKIEPEVRIAVKIPLPRFSLPRVCARLLLAEE